MSQKEDKSDVTMDSAEEKEPTSKTCFCKCCVFDGICFRTSIIAMVVALYLLIGGAIFLALEGPEESISNQDITNANSSLVLVEDQIVSFLTNGTVLNDTDAESLVDMLKQLTLQNSTSTTDNWNYGSSVFFCTTVITTIGYGKLAPITNGGRGFFIVYALVGIPMTLILLTLLSKILNNIIEWLLNKLGKHTRKRWVKILTFVVILFTGLIFFILIPSVLFLPLQGWTYFEGIYYCFVTLTTVGFGDLVPTQSANNARFQGIYRVCTSGWIWFGLAFVALLISRVQSLLEGVGDKCRRSCYKCCGKTSPVLEMKAISDEDQHV